MYNFIYYILYKHQINKGSSTTFASYNAALIVAFTLVVHAMFLFSVFKKIFYNWFKDHTPYISKNITAPVALLIMAGVFIYYNNIKTEKFLNKYSEKQKSKGICDFIKIMVMIFLPLIITIFLSKK